MVKQNSRPGDFTGQAKAKLAKEHAEEVAKREGELAMMEAAEQEAAQNRVTDYTAGNLSEPVILDSVEDVAAAEQEIQMDSEGVTVREAPTRTIRVNSDLESVTIGAGNHYSFNEGEKYKVPAHVAEHLEEKGYIWH